MAREATFGGPGYNMNVQQKDMKRKGKVYTYYYVYANINKPDGSQDQVYLGPAALDPETKEPYIDETTGRKIPRLKKETTRIYAYYDIDKGEWIDVINPSKEEISRLKRKSVQIGGGDLWAKGANTQVVNLEGQGKIVNFQLVSYHDVLPTLFHKEPEELQEELDERVNEAVEERLKEIKEREEQIEEVEEEAEEREKEVTKTEEKMKSVIDGVNDALGIKGKQRLTINDITNPRSKRFKRNREGLIDRVQVLAEQGTDISEVRQQLLRTMRAPVGAIARPEEMGNWIKGRELLISQKVGDELDRDKPPKGKKTNSYSISEGAPRWYTNPLIMGRDPSELKPWFELEEQERKEIATLYHSLPGLSNPEALGEERYQENVIQRGMPVQEFVLTSVREKMSDYTKVGRNREKYIVTGRKKPSTEQQMRGSY
jgi:hypothetical protein